MKEIVLGIDIGGTNTKLGLLDRDGKCNGNDRFRTDAEDGFPAYFERLTNHINQLLGPGRDRMALRGIGVGAPNGNYYKGTVENPPNLNWGKEVALVEHLRNYYQVPVALTNDANAAAIGEKLYGGAKQMDHFLMITLGTGLGSGIVVNGQLVHGHTGYAGEMGHITAIKDGRQCSCGRKGCLEAYVSARGIVTTATQLLEKEAQPSALREMKTSLTPKDIYEFARDGDPIALAAMGETGRVLGKQLANSVALLSPEAIFFTGGIAKAGNLLLRPTLEALNENLLGLFKGTVKLMVSSLVDCDPGVMGAAALIWKEIIKFHGEKVVK